MKKQMLTTYVMLKVEHTQPIPELTDLIDGRVYTMTHIEDVTATIVEPQENENATT